MGKGRKERTFWDVYGEEVERKLKRLREIDAEEQRKHKEEFDLSEYENGLEAYNPIPLAKRLVEVLEESKGNLDNTRVRAVFEEFSQLYGVWLREVELPC